jgi:hypothetical protein
VALFFDCHLVNPLLAIFLFIPYLQVPKGKEEEKKDIRCLVLGTISCIILYYLL